MIELPFCVHCGLVKASRNNFQSTIHVTKGILEYIHLGLWGPTRISTHGGARYFLTLIDDFSRTLWIFMLKTKAETFNWFQEWKMRIEIQIGKKIKLLRTDNGLEYLNEKFDCLCKTVGMT